MQYCTNYIIMYKKCLYFAINLYVFLVCKKSVVQSAKIYKDLHINRCKVDLNYVHTLF